MGKAADIFNKLEDIQKKARKKGADQVWIAHSQSESLSVEVLNDGVENIDTSNSSSISISVIIGQKEGSTSIDSVRPEHIERGLDEAIFNAKTKTDDPYVGLVDPDQLSDNYPSPEIYDASIPSAEQLSQRAIEASTVALSSDKAIVTASGAASWGRSTTQILSSNGFAGGYQRSSNGTQALAIGLSQAGQQRDYDYDSKIFLSDLRDAKSIGEEAGRRTMASLDPQSVKPMKAPVVFSSRISSSLIGAFTSAIMGGAVEKKETFLLDKLGKSVFSKDITIIDDPLMDRRFGSRPFDLEGQAARETVLVKDGILQSWIMSAYRARKLNDISGTNYKSTGHEGISSLALYMQPGKQSPDELISEVQDGFYVTGLMGKSISIIDGSYSVGANGFWIKGGKISHAVSEVTIGGNLKDMFNELEIGNDVDVKAGKTVPTIRIPTMVLG